MSEAFVMVEARRPDRRCQGERGDDPPCLWHQQQGTSIGIWLLSGSHQEEDYENLSGYRH
jgi:hypothetical protein